MSQCLHIIKPGTNATLLTSLLPVPKPLTFPTHDFGFPHTLRENCQGLRQASFGSVDARRALSSVPLWPHPRRR
jgi:hypothetical protein